MKLIIRFIFTQENIFDISVYFTIFLLKSEKFGLEGGNKMGYFYVLVFQHGRGRRTRLILTYLFCVIMKTLLSSKTVNSCVLYFQFSLGYNIHIHGIKSFKSDFTLSCVLCSRYRLIILHICKQLSPDTTAQIQFKSFVKEYRSNKHVRVDILLPKQKFKRNTNKSYP